MVKNSLGFIEVIGLAAALVAADAAVKAANVELIGYELTKGGGLVLVKLCGDVGAVKAGVDAGSSAASKVSKVWSTHVIARPHQQLSCILVQEENQGLKEEPMPIIETPSSELNHEDSESDDSIGMDQQEMKPVDLCNLCNDPACHRKKWEPKITCIHYEKNNEK